MRIVEIDGSYGEGGGQILRTALSLSCVTGHALKLFHIRTGRKRPGLMPQHVTCVRAAAEISAAEIQGAEAGSQELLYIPGKTVSGNYTFDITTAGSCTLVFQTLLPPLLFGERTSVITIKGGTHVPFSPVYDYFSEVLLPMLQTAGIDVQPRICAYGFYPRGGGEVSFTVHPVSRIRGLHLSVRGALTSLRGRSAVSGLPLQIARRQKSAMQQNIGILPADIEVLDVASPGKGTFAFLTAQYENSCAGFSAIGTRGKPAEEVGEEAAAAFLNFHRTSAVCDPCLADQLVLYLSLSGEDSSFTTSRITGHLLTNLWVIQKFLELKYEVEGQLHSEGTVNLTVP